MLKIMFFDTETTWLTPWVDRIIQFGAIYGAYDPEEKKFYEERIINQYIDPEMPIPASSTQIHGITNEFVKKFWNMSLYLKEFLAYLNKCDIVVGHNIEYDWKMLEWEQSRHNNEIWLFPRKICTMKSRVEHKMKTENIEVKYPKLTEIHKELLWKDFDNAHDALADIRATKDVFFEMVNKWIITIQ